MINILKGAAWKNTEDQILKAAVMKYGLNQWDRVSSLLINKSAKQCKSRWFFWLNPKIIKTKWSFNEDERLIYLSYLFPSQWNTIGPLLGRTPESCLDRYEKLISIKVFVNKEKDINRKSHTNKYKKIGINLESKPPVIDDIRNDFDMQNILVEARARLANTKGKKAKRKIKKFGSYYNNFIQSEKVLYDKNIDTFNRLIFYDMNIKERKESIKYTYGDKIKYLIKDKKKSNISPRIKFNNTYNKKFKKLIYLAYKIKNSDNIKSKNYLLKDCTYNILKTTKPLFNYVSSRLILKSLRKYQNSKLLIQSKEHKHINSLSKVHPLSNNYIDSKLKKYRKYKNNLRYINLKKAYFFELNNKSILTKLNHCDIIRQISKTNGCYKLRINCKKFDFFYWFNSSIKPIQPLNKFTGSIFYLTNVKKIYLSLLFFKYYNFKKGLSNKKIKTIIENRIKTYYSTFGYFYKYYLLNTIKKSVYFTKKNSLLYKIKLAMKRITKEAKYFSTILINIINIKYFYVKSFSKLIN